VKSFSMNFTPFPGIVCAIIIVGFSYVAFAWCVASIICLMLCPSISITFQLNASYFFLSGSSGIMSSVYPSICMLFLSSIAIMLFSLCLPANIIASHICPSCCSPSLIMQYM